MTGGWDGDNNLDSTEVLRPGSDWQEITSTKLPRPMEGVRVITVDNRVLLFGEWRQIIILTAQPTLTCLAGGSDRNPRNEILEYKDGRWEKIGTMNKAREYHGVSLINFNDFSDYCT